MFEDLEFRYPFRKYQEMILAQVAGEIESGKSDDKFHIVAPPGAGKTIVGLELIRIFGQPAVVFAPTSTIQQQWRQKVSMFLKEGQPSEEWTSLDPSHLAPLNFFTYQLISTVAEAKEQVEVMALRLWETDLLEGGQVDEEEAAKARIAEVKQNNPQAYRKEISRRYLRVKRRLLREDPALIKDFLHPNAVKLIDKLVEYGVKTVVLDECHHLLDYWAIVLRHLISRIEKVQVIGLTATLPSPDGDAEYENYTSLLGEVDFEVPTPAVVKEGDLAPHRDLVYFVEPTEREYGHLKNIQAEFEKAIGELTESPDFANWVKNCLPEIDPIEGSSGDNGTAIEEGKEGDSEALGGASAEERWQAFLDRRPLFALAALRFLNQQGINLPEGLPLPQEAQEKLNLEDWTYLLEGYGLKHLRVSKHKADHEKFRYLRRALQPFGFTLTEKGLRQSRSPGDLVLSFSEAKDLAVGKILANEARELGERLRAVVVTDFERMSSGVKRLKGVLEADAGSARRVFRGLVRHPGAGKLDPILVTGKTVLVDADLGNELLQFFNDFLREGGYEATCHYEATDSADIWELTGEGRHWSTRTYVLMVTQAFERGLTRCLVGTRGIFGEGWDSLSLNTLIDLTSVTTSASVQQLRGRTIRLDPAWPEKLAHNWDVICIAPKFDRGDMDLLRLVRRHNQYWGLVFETRYGEIKEDLVNVMFAGPDASLAPSTKMTGMIVKGMTHLRPKLARDAATKSIKKIDWSGHTQWMLKQIGLRKQSYAAWRIGEDYQNFSYKMTQLETIDLKMRSVYTLGDSLKRMVRAFLLTMGWGLFWSLFFGLRFTGEVAPLGIDPASFLLYFLVGGTLLTFGFNFRTARKIWRRLIVEQPADTILLDLGRALLATLKEVGMVSRHLQADYIRVIQQPDYSYQVLLDYASPEEAQLFATAYQELFEPVRNQRYLILRDETRLPQSSLRPLWLLLRRWAKAVGYWEPAYHPLPKVLAARKESALAFARQWQRYVGGGELVYTRTQQGRRLLLAAKAQRRPKVKQMAFEVWR